MVFKPINNREVELLLEAALSGNNKGNKKLEDFVIAEFFSKEQSSYHEIVYMRECLKHHLILNGYDRRKINNNLNSKHPIDVLRALKYYEEGNVINLIVMIPAIFHDVPEEGKETAIEIGRFLKTTINSLKLDAEIREQYLVDVSKIRRYINILTDPYYRILQKIKHSADDFIPYYEKNNIEPSSEILRLKEIIDEERGQLLVTKIHRILKTELSNWDYPKYLIDPLKRNIGDMRNKDHIGYTMNALKEWLTTVIKAADNLKQNYELDEIPYLNGEGFRRYLKKHAIIQRYGQDYLDELKKGKKDDDEFVEGLTLREYNSLEDFKIRGPDILQAICKRFVNLDFCCRNINTRMYYNGNKLATVINLKNALVDTTLDNVIKKRKDHLKELFHVSEDDIRRIEQDIDNYERDGHVYRVTDIKSPNDMLLKYYLPAMKGEYDNLMSLDFDKNLQYRHLRLWELIFLRYKEDCVRDDSGQLKNKDLFIFGWGNYLDVRNGG